MVVICVFRIRFRIYTQTGSGSWAQNNRILATFVYCVPAPASFARRLVGVEQGAVVVRHLAPGRCSLRLRPRLKDAAILTEHSYGYQINVRRVYSDFFHLSMHT